jgi:EAL domain-containing protein (putative c-di-GMP-specific phosphodiesterase class I)
MTSRIGRYVLNETCRFIFENKLISHGIDTVALNLSAAECMQQNYVEYAKKTISSYPFEKSILALEITETIAASARTHISDIMTALKPLGIKFSLDDYSQGYSNINALISLPFNIVKLDKEFLWKALESYKADILYRHTVRMFQEMGLRIIAEGAETEEQVKFLASLGVDYIQGYYYGKPLSKEEFLEEVLEADDSSLFKKHII